MCWWIAEGSRDSEVKKALGKDPFLAVAVESAFPQQLVDSYGEEIRAHRLHREIMCTQIANDIAVEITSSPILTQLDTLDLSMGSLDAPTGLRLGKHIFTADKGDYYDITDDLPQKG